jgi:hypothetical protein
MKYILTITALLLFDPIWQQPTAVAPLQEVIDGSAIEMTTRKWLLTSHLQVS